MKKSIAVILSAAMALSLAACGNPQTTQKPTEQTKVETTEKVVESLEPTKQENKEAATAPAKETESTESNNETKVEEETEETVSEETESKFLSLAAGDKVPDGFVYKSKADNKEYKAGDMMPSEALEGDVFETGEFVYTMTKIMSQANGEPQEVSGWRVSCPQAKSIGKVTETFYENINGTDVISVLRLFEGNSSLGETPALPDTIIDMSGAFTKCASLTKVTNIPKNVENMNMTFAQCPSLSNPPEIPSSVREMVGTFMQCPSLLKAPDLFNCINLYTIQNAFKQCASLMGDIHLPANLAFMQNAFEGCPSLMGMITIDDASDMVAHNCKDAFKGTNGITVKGDFPEDVVKEFEASTNNITVEKQ